MLESDPYVRLGDLQEGYSPKFLTFTVVVGSVTNEDMAHVKFATMLTIINYLANFKHTRAHTKHLLLLYQNANDSISSDVLQHKISTRIASLVPIP